MMKKSWKSRKISAFTLLECLVALLVISGSVLVIQGLSKIVSAQIQHEQNDNESDWLIFCQQLRNEFSAAQFVKIDQNQLYIQKDKIYRYGKFSADDFRKTDENGQGYQPMLYHLRNVQISGRNKLVQLIFTFENGEEQTFYYQF